MKIKAKEKNGIVNVKTLVKHEMTTYNQAEKKTGDRNKTSFLQEPKNYIHSLQQRAKIHRYSSARPSLTYLVCTKITTLPSRKISKRFAIFFDEILQKRGKGKGISLIWAASSTYCICA